MTLPGALSLKVTVPLLLLGFAGMLAAINLFYFVPQAERAAQDDMRKRMAQEMSRLQSTAEYLLVKGDTAVAAHEIAVLSHNHDVVFAALIDDRNSVVASTRRAWIGQNIAVASREFDSTQATSAVRERRAHVAFEPNTNALVGYAGVLLGGPSDEIRPSRTGMLYVGYDLGRHEKDARAQILQQSIYWAGWVTALALVMWLVFHYVLTRRTAKLVHAAEQIASGNLSARSGLTGRDELGRLGRAFDDMAKVVAETQTRLEHDIAERKRAEEALRISEANYRAIFDAAEDAIFIHDIETGTILDVNPKACETYGYTRDEFRAVDIGTLSSGAPPYTQQHAVRLMKRIVSGEQLTMEWHARRKSGELFWFEVSGKRVNIGGHDRILALGRDITDRKRAAEELTHQREALYQREKLAALGSLLAGVAHELNNPLSVVVARAVLLEEQGDATTRGAALRIRTAAERCARIVRTFLAMARQQKPERGPVAVDEVVTAALDIAGYALRTSGIEVRVELAEDAPLINADADQLHQVLLNLVINAQQSLQDMPLPRRIRIRSVIDRKAGMLALTVADNGPGIPPHLKARVFEPFFTTKPTGVGTGVGLAVSLGIIEAHGGTMSVDAAPGGGAAFTIRLPLGDGAAAGELVAAPASSLREAHYRILIVDDEAEIRDTLCEILTGAGHDVAVAASGRDALKRMGIETFDVIVTDIRMPDLDGRALYQEIRARWPGKAARVVFITGDTLASTLRDFVTASGRPVIEKPFLPADVRRVVAELVARD
jgi:two-component system NtrC family sensor kinase